jgi:hypothetical protein
MTMSIEVTLIDAATGHEIARTRQAAEDLPADFLDATLQLAGETWQVESAEPPFREEYVRSGALQLILRKAPPVSTIPTKLLGFSMSSICDELPCDGGPIGDGLALSLKDDLWRDIEFIGPGHEDAIEANFAAIQRIYDDHHPGPGFTQIHVRTEPRTPLTGCALTLADLSNRLAAQSRHPVTIIGYAGCIPGGFALPLSSGLTVYGCTDNDVVTVAAIDHTMGDASAAVESLADLVNDLRLSLVDWRSRLRINDAETLRTWLRTPPPALWR